MRQEVTMRTATASIILVRVVSNFLVKAETPPFMELIRLSSTP